MPTLDDVGIAVVQRGDLSRGVTIPGITVTGGRGSTTGGGRGGRAPEAHVALAPLQPLARAREYPRGLFTTTMRYRPTRTNPCRCGYDRGSRLVGPAVLAPLRLSQQQPGPRARRARRTGGQQRWPRLQRWQARAHQSPARRLPPQRVPRRQRRQVAPLHRLNGPTGAFGDLGISQSRCALFRFLFARLITSAFRRPGRHRRLEHPAWPPWRVLCL
jgi:hypothetical protein